MIVILIIIAITLKPQRSMNEVGAFDSSTDTLIWTPSPSFALSLSNDSCPQSASFRAKRRVYPAILTTQPLGSNQALHRVQSVSILPPQQTSESWLQGAVYLKEMRFTIHRKLQNINIL